MNITERQRQLIEEALDEALCAPDDDRTMVLIERALRIVREQPKGVRRIRSDAFVPRGPFNRDMWLQGWDPR